MKNIFLIILFFLLPDLSSFAQSNEILKFAKVKKGNQWGVMNESGKLIIPCIYEDIWIGNDDLFLFKFKGKYGYINSKGKIVINPNYDEAGLFSENLASVSNGKKYGFINRKGKIIIDFEFENVGSFSEGLAAFKKGNHWGFIDHSRNEIIKPIFNQVFSFYSGSAVVKLNENYGAIDKQGKILIPIEMNNLVHANRDLFKAEKTFVNQETKKNVTYVGLVNKNNEIIVPFDYISFVIRREAFYSFIPGINFEEDINNFIFIDKGYKHSLISNKGKIKACCYNEVDYSGVYLYSFRKLSYPKEWIVMDTSGNEILDSTYEAIGIYSEGLLPVKKNGLWGFINLRNELIIKYEFSSVSSFYHGAALAINEQHLMLIDKDGKTIVADLPFDKKIPSFNPVFDSPFMVLEKDGKYGAINSSGEIVFEPIYENNIDFRIEKNYRIWYPY